MKLPLNLFSFFGQEKEKYFLDREEEKKEDKK